MNLRTVVIVLIEPLGHYMLTSTTDWVPCHGTLHDHKYLRQYKVDQVGWRYH